MNRIGKTTMKAREAVFVEFQPSATGGKKSFNIAISGLFGYQH
jgi:hypothetical protein